MTCAKQTVTATIVMPGGKRFVGTNWVRNPQPVCPRADMPTGVGYELCRDICDQTAHAEINAIAAAQALPFGAQGGTLYLEGHTYACEPCKAACAAAGIVAIVIGPPPMTSTPPPKEAQMSVTSKQIALMRDIRMKGAIDGLLFSPHRTAGPGLREGGYLDGRGDSTCLSAKGLAALAEADAKLRCPQ